MKDIKVLIVPDVHGREFWRKPVLETLENNENVPIIFLGDYLSPYTFYEKITNEDAIKIFKEIIELAKTHSNIHLLIGNHDGSVIGPATVCECRLDKQNRFSNQKLFNDNEKLFDICYETTINNKKFLLSHAGYTNEWLEYYDDGYFETLVKQNLNVCLVLNNRFHLTFMVDEEFDDFWYVMSDFDYYRGGWDRKASILWTDIRNLISNSKRPKDVIQIVGHTMLNNKPINYNNEVYCVDCQKCFYIDSNGDVRYYNTDEIVGLSNQK